MEPDRDSGIEKERAEVAPANPDPSPKQRSRLRWITRYWPLAAGALTGLMLRFVFSGNPGGPLQPMLPAFIFLAPMAVGAITVYVAEIEQRRTWTYYASAPVLANVLFVAGTLAILYEGLICVAVVLPLFILLGAVGGLIMGVICRVTLWPRHAAYVFVALPLVLGVIPAPDPAQQRIGTIERSIAVAAPPEAIWGEINNVRDIQPAEVDRAWIYRIGVPLPIEGVTQQTPTERVRRITMGKAVHFDMVVADWEPNRHVRWTYRFDEDSFPPRAFDDHVRIGGPYFDMIDTSYTLVPIDATSTLLQIRMRYRVSTQFNWYADGVARLLIGNFEDVILGFYERRATRG